MFENDNYLTFHGSKGLHVLKIGGAIGNGYMSIIKTYHEMALLCKDLSYVIVDRIRSSHLYKSKEWMVLETEPFARTSGEDWLKKGLGCRWP